MSFIAPISPLLLPGVNVEARNALTTLKRTALLARNNNPRTNPVMASPPVLTNATYYAANTAYTTGEVVYKSSNFYTCTTAGTTGASSPPTVSSGTATDGTVTWTFLLTFPTGIYSNAPSAGGNFYGWSGGADPRRGVFNLLGGIPATDAGTSYVKMTSTTVNGTRASFVNRVEFVTDSSLFAIRKFDVGANSAAQWRLIVDNQYVSTAALATVKSGWGHIIFDFTNAGGRKRRTLALEFNNSGLFGGVDVRITEGVYKAGNWYGCVPLRAAMSGDSYTAGGSLTNVSDAYPNQMADLLGIKSFCNAGIGSTGLLVSSSSGTAIQRAADVISFQPNVVFEANGQNDAAGGSTPAQIQAATLALLQAYRQGLPTAPIFCVDLHAKNNGGTGWTAGMAASAAKLAAVQQMNDPLVFFVPSISDPNGSWMTGTGATNNIKGDGNADYYVATDGQHPNLACCTHLLAPNMADAIMQKLAAY